MSEIVLSGVTKNYDKTKVLEGIELSVPNKSFYTLLGPSGSGKTTILKLIAGLENPTSGRIFIDGEDVTRKSPGDRNVSMVFQNYALYPHMTVRQNLSFPLESRKEDKQHIKSRVKEVADLLQIEQLLDKKPGQLSGGQAQRVALGRAIIRSPRAFLMDEPLSNLDAKLRIYMRNELKKLQSELQATIVYVTHDQTEAMTLADKLAVINNGKIYQIGAPIDVYTNPANVTSASFLGAPPMNFFNARLSTDEALNEKARVSLEETNVSFEIPTPAEFHKTGKVLLGVRPEGVFLKHNGPLNGVVDAVEILGRESIVHILFNDREIQFMTNEKVNAGERIHFDIDSEQVKLFDQSTGDRLL